MKRSSVANITLRITISLLYIIFGLSLASSVSADGETFIRTYGGPYYEQGSSVQQTRCGGYIIAGSGYGGVWLIKTDELGNHIWDTVRGDDYDNRGYSIDLTKEGDYIIGGGARFSGPADWDVYLLKTNKEGTMLWDTYIGGRGFDRGRFVQQTRDGGYIIVGVTDSYAQKLILIKTDSKGGVTDLENPRLNFACSDPGPGGYYSMPCADSEWDGEIW